jgi:ACT domain-containing protein
LIFFSLYSTITENIIHPRKEFDKMKKTIITVVGKDTVGIIAKVCTYLAENSVNILDISQTIVQDYFNMMMIVDANNTKKKFDELADELEALGEEIGVQIKMQSEDIFKAMHRI